MPRRRRNRPARRGNNNNNNQAGSAPPRRRPKRQPRRGGIEKYGFGNQITVWLMPPPINIGASTTAANNYYGFSFKLNDVVNYAHFTTTFDMYRIVEVVARFIPYANVNNAATAVADPGGYFTCYSVVDFDDATVPTTLAMLQSYNNCRQFMAYQRHVRRFQPTVLLETYKTTSTVGEGPRANTWIDTTTDFDLPHFGLKVAIVNVSATLPTFGSTHNLQLSYRVQFKASK